MRARALPRSLLPVLLCVTTLACGPRPMPPATPAPADAAPHHPATVQWSPWDRATFARAQRDRRLLLINVVAQWCHWCHVMDEQTYQDPEVAALLAEHFVAIRVDSDARPDVAQRYRAWGWPATGILSPDAEPILELQGFQEPRGMAELLRSLVADRDAGTLTRRRPLRAQTTPADAGRAVSSLAATAIAQLDAYYEPKLGGWGLVQKYPLAAPLEHAMVRSIVHADEDWSARVATTLGGEEHLIDPVWGGMYQYSLRRDWNHPHYEKIARVQAGAIGNFAMASRMLQDPRWLDGAYNVAEYVRSMLRHEDGGFFTSQDADVRNGHAISVVGRDYYALNAAQRRAQGTPSIDAHVYADNNGLLILALTELFVATGDPQVLADATAAAAHVLAGHRTVAGGFVHEANDEPEGLLYLRDQAAMGRALVALYRVTGERRYRRLAQQTADFMLTALADPAGGFFAQTADRAAVGALAVRRKPLEENATAVRLLLELDGYLDDNEGGLTPYGRAARAALRAIGGRAGVQERGRMIGEYVLALESANMQTVDITVVGHPTDPAARTLLAAALRPFEPRALVEMSPPGERYPDTGKPAVFLCTINVCSSPISDPAKVGDGLRRFVADNLP